MARTTVTANLKKEMWEEKLFRDTLVEMFFMRTFGATAMGNLEKGLSEKGLTSSPNDVLHIKTDLGAQGRRKSKNGDKVTFGLIPRIDPKTNQGVTSGQTLKGKEVALTQYDFDLELERYRQAVSAGGHMDWAESSFDMPVESRAALLAWGRDKLELLCFDALVSSPSSMFYINSADSVITRGTDLDTVKAALGATTSKLTPGLVSFMKAWAKTGGARASGQVPLRPVYVDGKPHYVFVTHEDALYDWKEDSRVQQAAREAEVRGKNNPIFAGADYVWDGVIMHTHEYVGGQNGLGTDGGGASVDWCYGHMLGAQSLCVAFGERPSVVEDTEDYEEDLFYAWRVTAKIEKPVFNSRDYGSIACLVSRTDVSGA